MSDTIQSRCDYLSRAFYDTETLATAARAALGDVEFDTMVGTGLSGALVIPRIADALGVAWMVVRKDNDGSHASTRGEGTLGRRWLFVDDFISSGATYKRVQRAILVLAELRNFKTEHVGAYEYEHDEFNAPDARRVRRYIITAGDKH